MENISDALKMAGAALLFVIALTVTIMLFSQARETAQIVLYSKDNTNYYQKLSPTEIGVTRVVGIETVIPTLYRYRQEGFAIRICDSSGNELQVFDYAIESMINGYDGSQISVVSEENKKIYEKYNTPGKDVYMAGAPWVTGDTNSSKLLERINSYIYGTPNSFEEIDYTQNYLMKYKEKHFEESYLEYNISGRYKDDGFGNWYTIVDGEQKVIITYTIKD